VPATGGSSTFVDPALTALDSPACWSADSGAAVLDARSDHSSPAAPADLTLAENRCVQHIVLGSDDLEYVLVRTTDRALTLRLRGERAYDAPVRLTFQVAGLVQARPAGALLTELPNLLISEPRRLKRTRRQILMRDALIALDGRHADASYRETAAVIVGKADADAAWSGRSGWLKERMRRALRDGQALRDGDYRGLLA